MAFCACECGSVFSARSVHTHPPSHLEQVSAGSIGCLRVAVYVVICTGLSCVLEYCVVYGVCSFHRGVYVFTNELTKARVEVWPFGCDGGVVGVGVAGYGPCSESANRRISFRKRDVREDVPVDTPLSTRICRIVVGDARVGFDLTDMGREA